MSSNTGRDRPKVKVVQPVTVRMFGSSNEDYLLKLEASRNKAVPVKKLPKADRPPKTVKLATRTKSGKPRKVRVPYTELEVAAAKLGWRRTRAVSPQFFLAEVARGNDRAKVANSHEMRRKLPMHRPNLSFWDDRSHAINVSRPNSPSHPVKYPKQPLATRQSQVLRAMHETQRSMDALATILSN
jgi:hypothetical protein